MDYKYIEQLLERYWDAETTLDEERILRAFFSDDTRVPAHLKRYAPLFVGWQAAKAPTLGADFDSRILAQVEQPVVKARRLTLRARLKPLYKAAAVVALLASTGVIAQRSIGDDNRPEQTMAQQKNDSTIEVQVAYEPNQLIDSVTVVDETILK